MKTLLTGGEGQLARALASAAPPRWPVTALSRAQLDIGDADAVNAAIDALRPELIINAAAYTAVDRAESEPGQAMRVNRDGAANLAAAAARLGARFVHVSTDFVFDGRSSRPYRPRDRAQPLNVYGASKLAGEAAVTAAGGRPLIVRSSWIYSARQGNFLTTMLRLMNSRPEVRVVADQIGTPTSAVSLARALWVLAQSEAAGIVHYADAGVASWYDFAQAIVDDAGALGLAPADVRVVPIATPDYPTPARRPAFSVMDRSLAWSLVGGPPPHWRHALGEVLRSLAATP
jgi:dTDP-4-dehydrorhamnose reductase